MPAPGERPTRLRVEHVEDALGIDEPQPRLSWWLPKGSARQHAYRVRTSAGADTGRLASDRSVLVPWPARPLVSAERVEWQVKVWTDRGESDWSEPAAVETGLLTAADWTASWISPDETALPDPGQRPALLLRYAFHLARPARRARLYGTAYGLYEAFLNGARVGNVELTPGYTEYTKRLQVQTYAVTEHLSQGDNALCVVLSDGWFRGTVGALQSANQWGERLALLAQLVVDLEDGTRATFGTGAGWRWTEGHVKADLMLGQSTDLLTQPLGWLDASFDDDAWRPVPVVLLGFANLIGSPAPPVRRLLEIAPVAVRRVPSGAQVVDLGQNINGWVRLRELGPAGTVIRLEHREAVDADSEVTVGAPSAGMPFDPARLERLQRDVVVSDGSGVAVEPRHTTHGFRYVGVTGHPRDLTPADVEGIVVASDLRRTGWFECSDERLNRLHEAARWSFLGNACDIPTDCPTRERAGWTGDWQVFVPTAAFLYDVAGFSTKWLCDLAAEQRDDGAVANLAPSPPVEGWSGPMAHLNGSAGWGDAAIIVPWELWVAYGDSGVLARQWDSMVAWLRYVERSAAAGRHPGRVARGLERPHERYLWDTGFHWGEWLTPEGQPKDLAAYARVDKSDTATAYYAYSAYLLSRIAEVLGRGGDAQRYAALARNVREAWCTEFLHSDGTVRPATQANCVRALAFGLVPSTAQLTVAAQLARLVRDAGTHLTTGFLATPLLLPVLADHGCLDLAYELLLRDSAPSWLAMISRGATTMEELWEGVDENGVAHESLNHYSKGAVISFLHRYVAGLRPLRSPDAVAYRRFEVRPMPGGGLTFARATLDTPYGRAESAWHRTERGLRLEVTVPPGTRADLHLPDGAMHTVQGGRHVFE